MSCYKIKYKLQEKLRTIVVEGNSPEIAVSNLNKWLEEEIEIIEINNCTDRYKDI